MAATSRSARPGRARPSRPQAPAPRRAEAPRHAPFLFAGVLAVAAVVRLWHLGHGLPDLLEEAYPFRQALELWGWDTGRTDWNPHFFFYPSLSLYLHFLLQKAAVGMGMLTGR